MNKYIQYDENGDIIDIIIQIQDRSISMLGSGGKIREKKIASHFITALQKAEMSSKVLPVLLGSGAGYALKEILENTTSPIAVIDKEFFLNDTQLKEKITDQRINWICSSNIEEVFSALTHWQIQHGRLPLYPLVHPFYFRIDKPWYQKIKQYVAASTRFDFWSKAIRPRFSTAEPRLLLITTRYFLLGVIEEACNRLGIPHQIITIQDEETGCVEFVEQLLTSVATFHPDFILTINHFGVDKEGILVDLLAKLELPMASWFVDNPHLIIHEYGEVVSPWTAIFTWDENTLHSLKEYGYPHVFYLPLGTSQYRFRPRMPQDKPLSSVFPTHLSFVGNSMVYKVEEQIEKGNFPSILLQHYKNIASDFIYSDKRSIQQFLKETYPEYYKEYLKLPDVEQRLAYEAMLTWESTLQYRFSCVEQLLSFQPVIVGDNGWYELLSNYKDNWSYCPSVNYYNTLPSIYRFSDINFNSTSKQMKGAVNQRVFDIPATGSFLITDWQQQMDTLFEPNKEVVSYREVGEIRELVQYYLTHPNQRKSIASAARQRVLAEHTWEHRLQTLLEHMRQTYG
ncbi:hypothetical protein BW722_00750 [Lawsonia intracellularis]|nr:hypothetical protein BW722_00750 [Lawsonia intracellularis]